MRPARAAATCGVFLSLLLAFVGCDVRHRSGPVDEIRQLDQIPIRQLRLMLKGYPGDWRAAGERTTKEPEPPTQKPVPVGAQRLELPAPLDAGLGAVSVRDAIAARRSAREFTNEGISLQELSFLLWATQGVTRVEKDQNGQILHQYRAAPSAGGRYPLETYLAVSRVEGLVPGLYRYLPNEHQLLLVREEAKLGEQLGAACYGTPAASRAAVVLIWSATPGRTEWKYAFLAHRMIAMEAGHVCQNLYLAAESCRIGVCALLSYHQPLLDKMLGLDGDEEFTLYLAGVGKTADPVR